MSEVKFIIDEESFRRTERQLARLPGALEKQLVPPALRSAAAIAAAKMRKMAPDSKVTGTRRKWSAYMKAKRGSTKQHRQTIGVSTVRKYGQITAVYAGPIHPAGNLINVIGHDHKQILWGRPTGNVIDANEYVIDAGIATKSQQQAAFQASVKRGVIREALKR